MTLIKKGIYNAIGGVILFGLISLSACQDSASDGSPATENASAQTNNGNQQNPGDQKPVQAPDPDLDSIKDPRAATDLQDICHFIKKDSIDLYVNNYRKWKEANLSQKPPTSQNIGSVESFNKSIIQVILSRADVVGLRVIHGMDSKDSLHTILVGIGTNYQNVYIKRSQACPGSAKPDKPTSTLNRWFNPASPMAFLPPPPPQGDDDGGAEMGQMP